MPVEPLDKAHLDQLPDEPGAIVDPLRAPHQVVVPKARLGLVRQWHSHGALLQQHCAAEHRG
jgi:hypothetical protein